MNPTPESPPDLASAIVRLRSDLAGAHAPPAVWNKVRAAAVTPVLPGQKAPVPPRPVIAWPAWTAGTAVLLALMLVWWVGPGRSSAPRGPAPGIDAGPISPMPRGSGFVPVASPERFAELWQGGAQTAPAWVVRTELPRERLAALGLPYDPARAGEPVHAELLMHPSGDVLAVRLTR